MSLRAAMGAAALALGFSAAPNVSLAEGFTIIDLGGTRSRETCMYRAERAFRRYRDELGLSEVNVSQWIVFGYDLGPGDQDVTIMCPILGANGEIVNAFLNVHGETTPAQREATAAALERYWNE